MSTGSTSGAREPANQAEADSAGHQVIALCEVARAALAEPMIAATFGLVDPMTVCGNLVKAREALALAIELIGVTKWPALSQEKAG